MKFAFSFSFFFDHIRHHTTNQISVSAKRNYEIVNFFFHVVSLICVRVLKHSFNYSSKIKSVKNFSKWNAFFFLFEFFPYKFETIF